MVLQILNADLLCSICFQHLLEAKELSNKLLRSTRIKKMFYSKSQIINRNSNWQDEQENKRKLIIADVLYLTFKVKMNYF